MIAANHQEFEELLARLSEGELTPAQGRALEALLLHSAQHRDEYLAYVKTHLLMSTHFADPERGMSALSEKIQPPIPHKSGPLTVSYWRHRPLRFGAMALVLTLLLWVGFCFAFLKDAGRHPQDSTIPQHNFIAQLTEAHSPVWSESATEWQLMAGLCQGDTLSLEHGLVEVCFADGAVVVLEGPVEFQVNTPGAGTLERGRLVARIERPREEAIGFAISTPLAEILDLGTEFGVEVSETGATDVEVFQGRVDATPNKTDRRGSRNSLLLGAGQAASLAVGSDSFVLRDIYAHRYVQNVPADNESLPPREIRPFDVTSPSPHNSTASLRRLIDGSGLLGFGPLATRKHVGFDSRAADSPGDENCWTGMSPFGHTPERQLIFDLGDSYDLTQVYLWNYTHIRQGEWLERGAAHIEVAISNDGLNYETIGEILPEAATCVRTEAQSFPLAGRGRYVRFMVLACHKPIASGDTASHFGLGEVRFEGVPVGD